MHTRRQTFFLFSICSYKQRLRKMYFIHIIITKNARKYCISEEKNFERPKYLDFKTPKIIDYL